ncbi:hypothetical protein M422DRAFT_243139 [Sphaerobolus stellatus SS14]|nr:hypothetical protein M422DRAFT_243139 [Sphaerobolus stellatus SS14]
MLSGSQILRNPNVVRPIVLVAICIFSLICLGLSVLLLILLRFPGTAPGMNVATVVLTCLLTIPVIVIEWRRTDAFTSLISVELGRSFLLMILWVAAAGLSTSESCFVNDGAGICIGFAVLVAFGWLNSLLCLGWFTFILTLCIVSHSRGNSGVWTQRITEVDFMACRSKADLVNKQQPHLTIPIDLQYGGSQLGSPASDPFKYQEDVPSVYVYSTDNKVQTLV